MKPNLETWLDREVPGLFARVANTGAPPVFDDDEMVDALGLAFASPGYRLDNPVVKPAKMEGFEDWQDVIDACRIAAMTFSAIREDADPERLYNDDFVGLLHPWVAEQVTQASRVGEIRWSMLDDLSLKPQPLTIRAHLFLEISEAVRDGWRFYRCAQCGGWHRIKRARDFSYCSRRCQNAANRERQNPAKE